MKKFQNVGGIALKILLSKEPITEVKRGHETVHVSEDSMH